MNGIVDFHSFFPTTKCDYLMIGLSGLLLATGLFQMNNINDKIIINELRKGNKDVFQVVFHQYYPLLAKFAHRYVYESNVCEDLIQDVLTSL
ncbi:sigma-70 family RNA polymerase sigma factor [Carboxylicivirga marina]|uniref:RNA polymerase sigma-70 region 2 domain-containing protein n=1 Tax=Carboxylicivirga marina TaxID=2800988 RepID=A0ABS1HP04_9BACT|nr:hypothetical protein [Carboxylicivirga marina]MBK3519428.1 hypothetical protein [Carboxylicivirga marina]